MALVAAHPAQPRAVAAGQRSVWRSVRPGRINWNEDDVEFWQQAEGVLGAHVNPFLIVAPHLKNGIQPCCIDLSC